MIIVGHADRNMCVSAGIILVLAEYAMNTSTIKSTGFRKKSGAFPISLRFVRYCRMAVYKCMAPLQQTGPMILEPGRQRGTKTLSYIFVDRLLRALYNEGSKGRHPFAKKL